MNDRPGLEIQPGTYAGAQRSGFTQPGHPGLDINFRSQGCNVLSGQFTVTSASFYQNRIASFSVSFEQYCENVEPLHGTFTFVDTSAPAAVPEPGTIILVGAAGLVGPLRRRWWRGAR